MASTDGFGQWLRGWRQRLSGLTQRLFARPDQRAGVGSGAEQGENGRSDTDLLSEVVQNEDCTRRLREIEKDRTANEIRAFRARAKWFFPSIVLLCLCILAICLAPSANVGFPVVYPLTFAIAVLATLWGRRGG